MCEDTVPYLDILAGEILDNSPDTRIQFYLTWGHPHAEGCSTYHCAYQSTSWFLSTLTQYAVVSRHYSRRRSAVARALTSSAPTQPCRFITSN